MGKKIKSPRKAKKDAENEQTLLNELDSSLWKQKLQGTKRDEKEIKKVKEELEKSEGDRKEEKTKKDETDEKKAQEKDLIIDSLKDYSFETPLISPFRFEDSLLKQRISSLANDLEETVDVEAPIRTPRGDVSYSPLSPKDVYGEMEGPYAPSDSRDDNGRDLSGYKERNERNYNYSQRDQDIEKSQNSYYEASSRIDEKVGEIRVNFFKDNLESAVSKRKKSFDF